MSAGLPFALRIGTPFTGSGFFEAPDHVRAVYQALATPTPQLDRTALGRLDPLAARVALLTGDRDDPAQRAEWLREAINDAGPHRGATLVSHPFHAAMATAFASESVTAACVQWTAALLAGMRLTWPEGLSRSKESREACYRVSLQLRRLIAAPAWAALDAPSPPLVLPSAAPPEMASEVPPLDLQRLNEVLEALARTPRQRDPGPRARSLPRHALAAADADSARAGLQRFVPDSGALTDYDDADDDPGADALDWTSLEGDAADVVMLASDPAWADHRLQHALADSMVRTLRGGTLSTAELARTLDAIEALDCARAVRDRAHVVVLAVAVLGVRWAALADSLRPLRTAADALAATRTGLLLTREGDEAPWEGWRVLAAPSLPEPPLGADADRLVPVCQRFRLPVDAPIAAALATRLARLPGSSITTAPDGAQVLAWRMQGLNLQAYEQHVDVIRAGRVSLRLEPGRLPSVFAAALAAVPGVEAATRHLLEREPDDALPAASFYTCLDIAMLAARYRAAQQALAASLPTWLPPPAALALPMLPAPSGATGSRRCPTRSAVRDALEAMARRVADTTCGMGDGLTAWAGHHTARVQQWALSLHVAFGLRRSDHALHRARFDARDGWLVLADKGPLERLLPLPPALRVQWQAWGHHLDRLWQAVAMMDEAAGAVAASMHAAWRRGELAGPTLSLLRVRAERVDTHPWRPASLDDALARAGVAVPVQCFRHAARSTLVARGVPEDEIDALLGHYRTGAEPWSAWSLQTLATLHARLESHAEALLHATAEARRV